MSPSPHRVVAALIVALLGSPLRGQTPADSGTAAVPQQPMSTSHPQPSTDLGVDRPVIPVATLVEERGARNLTDVLISRVPGLEVIPGPGVNGAGSRIRLRGVQSLVADRAPLVMVDGVRVDATEDAFSPTVPQGFPFDNPPPSTPGPLRLDDLDVEDIESVEVLGPASTAVYGPGASAGVLLIHTKRGRPGPAHWEGYAQGGVSRESTAWPANFGAFDLDNSNATFQRGLCTLGAQAVGLCVPDFMRQFNPLEQRSPFRTALRRQYGLSVSGGSGWGDYRLAGGFDGAGGAYSSRVTSPDPNYYRRLNGRASGHIRPWSGLELGVNAARMSSDLRLPPNVLETARLVEPSDSAGFEWGRMFRAQNTQAIERWLGVVEARWSPLSWVAVHGVAGFDAFDQRDAVFEPFVPTDAFPRGYLAEGTRETRHRTLALAGSATRKLSNAVQSTTTVGVEQLRDRLAQDWTARSDTGTGFGTAYRSAWLRQQQHSLGYYVEERLDFGQRILLTGAVRHDKFKEEQRGATYPSVNVSWAAHAADSAAVSLLRLRAAYGSAGPRPFEGAPVIFVPIGTPLPRIEPERTRSLELGADAGLFAGRLTGRVTYYDMRSRVFRLTVSQGFGGPGVDYSAGTVANRGIEATVGGQVLTGPAVAWDLTLSLWGNRNRLTKWDAAPFFFGAWSTQGAAPGYPVGGYWGLPIQRFADANGDGIIAPAEVVLGERAWAGTPYPTQGALLSSEWTLGGAFRAGLTLDYRAGHRLFNYVAYERCLYLVCREAYDPRTPLAEQARAVAGEPTNGYFEDADYLKLREVSLTWSVPRRVAAALHARAATVRVAGRDLMTWTGYSGADPEAGSYGALGYGDPRTVADTGVLPVPRSWTLRLQLAY